MREIANLGSEEGLPHFKKGSPVLITPVFESLFEVEANFPKSFLENIVSYDLDTVNKRVTFTANLNEETLCEFQLFSTESIRISHHDRNGKVIIKTELETITNPAFMSLSADYMSADLLKGRFTFHYGTIYQSY